MRKYVIVTCIWIMCMLVYVIVTSGSSGKEVKVKVAQSCPTLCDSHGL